MKAVAVTIGVVGFPRVHVARSIRPKAHRDTTITLIHDNRCIWPCSFATLLAEYPDRFGRTLSMSRSRNKPYAVGRVHHDVTTTAFGSC